MANIMTKRGSQDNVITFEHYCDTTADLQTIPKDQITLGSVAIVVEGDSGGMEAYIANSKKEWGMLMGNDNNQFSLSNIIHICNNQEYDKDTKTPIISEPEENVFYLVPAREDSNDSFEEWIYVENKWEHFGAGGTIEIPQSDWNQTDEEASNYIKNKPNVKTQQVLINDPEALSETSTTFISNISQNANGEIQAIKKTLPVQGQADWNTTDPSSNDYIRNKPNVKLKQTAVSDPEASEETSTTFIDSVAQDENGVITATKKTVVTQKQADWMQTSATAPDYIRHKPSIKTTQSTVKDPTALDETSTTFISNISQNYNGVITPTKKKLPPIPDLSQSLTVGSTTVTEAQLQALLALLET